VRRIDANGVVTTVAGSIKGTTGLANSATPLDALFNGLSGIAVDDAGIIYVADAGNRLIRKITPQGVFPLSGTGAAGNQDGPAGSATFGVLGQLTVDSRGGYLYAVDHTNNAIRRISISDGSVTTPVGTPGVMGTVPGPLPASLNIPWGVVWDPSGSGHLLITVSDAILRATF